MPIEIEYLSFSYGAREILHDISLAIPDRTLVNVLGPNGVGSRRCSDASCASMPTTPERSRLTGATCARRPSASAPSSSPISRSRIPVYITTRSSTSFS